jgi:SOS-response transcriptional repressor LexA
MIYLSSRSIIPKKKGRKEEQETRERNYPLATEIKAAEMIRQKKCIINDHAEIIESLIKRR